jgi:hypothetical protein
MRMFKPPPGGFAGLGQQTRAAQLTVQRAMGSGGPTRRRGPAKRRKASRAAGANRRRSYASGPRTTRARAASRGMQKGRLVKGSAAAKRYMAKIRRMRKR